MKGTRSRIASAVSAALVGLALGAGLVALESGVAGSAFAQDDHGSGGHEGGKGGHESGGHDGGKGGDHVKGPPGGEHPGHGTMKGHQGHASGQHSGGHGGEDEQSSSAHGGSPRRFGGGSGLGTLDAVPEGPGQFGYSYGPGPQNQFRYWGGWSIPEEPTPPTVVVEESVPLSSGGGGGGGFGLSLSGTERCEGIGGDISPAQRISGRNLARINDVHGKLIAPGRAPHTVAPFLLANLQEELEKTRPDYQLAGVYLGTIAEQPVTPQIVSDAAFALCVRLGPEQAEQMAAVAEAQRNGKSTLRALATQPATAGASASAPALPAAPAAPPPVAAAAPAAVGAAPLGIATTSFGVLFPFDGARPLDSGTRTLDELTEALQDAQLEAVLAVGHADRIGPVAYNRKLSERRAAAVRDYLASKGVSVEKVAIEGRGESQPLTGAECRGLRGAKLVSCLQPDRRVDVEVRVLAGSAR